MSSALNGKVDKVDGKGLSTNDYDNTEKGKVANNTTARHTHSNKSVLDSTTASYTIDEKTKLSGIESGAEANIIETVKVNGTALIPSSKAVDVTVPTKVSDLTNDSGYTTNIGTITGITMNSESKGTSGTVDLGTVITAHQDITGKEDKSNKVTSMTSSSTDTQYPSAKAVYDELEDLKEENSELKQRIEDEENNQLTNTASGTNLNINDTASYPIREIQVKGNSVQDGTPTTSNIVLIKSSGDAKNLYYLPEAGTLNGITYSINEDRTINLSGTATGAVTFPVFKSIAEAQIENGETYTFSSNQALPSGVEFRAEAYNNSSWLRHLIGVVINNSVSSRTGTANTTNATRIRHLIYIGRGTTVNITNLGIQFEKGNTQTSFAPEGKGFINETISNSDNTQNQNYIIPCQQPMRSIGNVRDEFIKQDGLWYEKHNIGVIESYNGETITTDYMSTTGSLSTGAFIQYVLDDANYIECTQEQVTALEAIEKARTYKKTTNVYSEDITPAYITITYVRDLESAILSYIDASVNQAIGGAY